MELPYTRISIFVPLSSGDCGAKLLRVSAIKTVNVYGRGIDRCYTSAGRSSWLMKYAATHYNPFRKAGVHHCIAGHVAGAEAECAAAGCSKHPHQTHWPSWLSSCIKAASRRSLRDDVQGARSMAAA